MTGRWRKNTRGAEKGKKAEGMNGGRYRTCTVDGLIIGKTIVKQEKKKKKTQRTRTATGWI